MWMRNLRQMRSYSSWMKRETERGKKRQTNTDGAKWQSDQRVRRNVMAIVYLVFRNPREQYIGDRRCWMSIVSRRRNGAQQYIDYDRRGPLIKWQNVLPPTHQATLYSMCLCKSTNAKWIRMGIECEWMEMVVDDVCVVCAPCDCGRMWANHIIRSESVLEEIMDLMAMAWLNGKYIHAKFYLHPGAEPNVQMGNQ